MSQSEKRELFTNRTLAALILPLLVEQLLAITIGAADTVMVSSLGETAVSAVSLVDNINILLINLFSALTTGGAVVASQYLGSRDAEKANDSARQLYQLSILTAMAIGAACLIFNRGLLGMIFGAVEDAVMTDAVTYMALSAVSYPFLAAYNSGAALFRSMGNSKVSMYTSIMMNLVNIVGNAICIYGLKWGVAGAGAATLLSRVLGAVVITVLISDRKHPLHVRRLHRIAFDGGMVGRILRIGVPNGMENAMFQIGKLLVLNLISTFGTAAIAANAICNTLSSFAVLPGITVGIAMLTVVGQCMGAGDSEQAARNVKKLMMLAQGFMLLTGGLLALLSPQLTGLFNLSDEAFGMAVDIVIMYGICSFLFWAVSFTLPNALRAAGDAKFAMIVSTASMWICRVGLSYLFGSTFGWGLMGVWIAMVCDWVCRDAAYLARYISGAWKKQKVI